MKITRFGYSFNDKRIEVNLCHDCNPYGSISKEHYLEFLRASETTVWWTCENEEEIIIKISGKRLLGYPTPDLRMVVLF